MNKLSQEARSALIASISRQGAPVRANDAVRDELETLGFVGKGGGLTGKGVTARNRAVRQAEDLAFGA